MKRMLNYIPFILFTLAFVSFIIPVVYEKEEGITISYNTYDLLIGSGMQDMSIGLLIAFILLIISIVFSVTTIKNPTNFRLSVAVISGLVSGTLFFFSRILASPTITDLKLSAGLIIPGVLIIAATILIFINSKINANKKDSVSN